MRKLTEAERRELMQAQAALEQTRLLDKQNLKNNCGQPDSLRVIPTSTQCSAKSDFISVIMSNDPRAAEFDDTPAPVPCEYCGTLRYTKGIITRDKNLLDPTQKIFWLPTGPEPCDCEKAREQRAREQTEKEAARLAEEQAAKRARNLEQTRKIVKMSGMGLRFKARTFDVFQCLPENITAYNAAKSYADSFTKLLANPTEYEKNGLFFVGSKGTGKTHLAASIANKLMNEGVTVIIATMIELLDNIKNTFNQQSTGERPKLTEAELMKSYKEVDLLIIDDMGKEQPTRWALTKMYGIINARYENYAPIIVTSNYSADELVKRLTPADDDSVTADATIDRILEMAYIIPLAGESWRRKK